MASGSTALSYQQMVEGHLLGAMTRAADNANFYIACAYAKAYAILIGIEENKLPEEPIEADAKNANEFAVLWQQHYFKLWKTFATQIKQVLDDVRNRYRKDQDIPTSVKSTKSGGTP